MNPRVKIVEYDKARNTCYAELPNGDRLELDPFVSCALPMTSEDYEANKGFELVGKEFILIEYSVYRHNVVPHENGMLAV